jgi:hypothetical protein
MFYAVPRLQAQPTLVPNPCVSYEFKLIVFFIDCEMNDALVDFGEHHWFNLPTFK